MQNFTDEPAWLREMVFVLFPFLAGVTILICLAVFFKQDHSNQQATVNNPVVSCWQKCLLRAILFGLWLATFSVVMWLLPLFLASLAIFLFHFTNFFPIFYAHDPIVTPALVSSVTGQTYQQMNANCKLIAFGTQTERATLALRCNPTQIYKSN